jgi:hypothetical protein
MLFVPTVRRRLALFDNALAAGRGKSASAPSADHKDEKLRLPAAHERLLTRNDFIC